MTCEHDGLDFLSVTLAPTDYVDAECADCGRPVRVYGVWAQEDAS